MEESQKSGVPHTDNQISSEVPFDVLEPEAIPEGYELAFRELVRRGQSGALTEEKAQEVIGVVLTYLESDTEPGAQNGAILLEQKLGSKNGGYSIGHASKRGAESIRGYNTDVWNGRNVNNVPQTIFVWEDTNIGVRYTMATYLSLSEARAVAASLQ